MRTPTVVQRFVAEALGTFLLVFIGAGTGTAAALALLSTKQVAGSSSLLIIALAHGFALCIGIIIIGRVSGGHVNPAVTVGLASAGHFPWRDVPIYVVAQLVGAVVAALAIPLTYGKLAITAGNLGAPSVAPGLNIGQGLVIEGIGTAILVITITAAAVDKQAPVGWAGLAIGLSLAAIIMVIGPATGGSVNPARAFGPDLILGLNGGSVSWQAFLVAYLIGPLIGGVVGANLYNFIGGLSAGGAAKSGASAKEAASVGSSARAK